MTFEEYWETDGSRKDAADHKERARLAWNACYRSTVEALPLTLEWHKGWAACQEAHEEREKFAQKFSDRINGVCVKNPAEK